jgi:hypothetical protein
MLLNVTENRLSFRCNIKNCPWVFKVNLRTSDELNSTDEQIIGKGISKRKTVCNYDTESFTLH